MMQTDVNQLLSFQTSRQNYAGTSRTVSAPPPPHPSPASSDSLPQGGHSGDRVEVGPRSKAPESPDARAAEKMAETLEPKERQNFSDILRILNENAPNVFKSIRAIVAQRTGLDASNEAALDPELLAKTMKLAGGAPNPAQRLADVVKGVGLVPGPQQDAFLKAAGSVLEWEQKAAAAAVVAPWPSVGSKTPAPGIAIDPRSGTYEPREIGYAVEVNFDLFFSVSARSSMRGAQDASGSFYEATQKLSTSFESNFSIEIAGRFLNLADAAEAVDPKVLESFSRAVEGLAGLDQDALDRFFTAADQLFSALEDGYGLGDTALDGVAAQVKATAGSFFEAVSAAAQDVFPGLPIDQLFALPADLDKNGSTDLLTLMNSLAERRRPESFPRPLLEALNTGENARALNSATPPVDLWNLLQATQPAAA